MNEGLAVGAQFCKQGDQNPAEPNVWKDIGIGYSIPNIKIMGDYYPSKLAYAHFYLKGTLLFCIYDTLQKTTKPSYREYRSWQ